jgi:hypothetical protein
MVNNNNTPTGIYLKFISVVHSVTTNVRENIGIFIICLLLPISVLLINYFAGGKKYKASFTVAYEDLTRKVYGDRLEKLNILAKREDYKTLKYLLKINDKTAKAVSRIEGTNVLGQPLVDDMNTDKIPFVITLTVTDSSVVRDLEEGILNFLETGNAFLTARKKIREKELANELSFINGQLDMIDSYQKQLQQAIANNKSASTTQPPTSNSSMGSLYEYSYNLYKKRQELIYKQSMPNNLQVIDDTLVPKNAKRSIPELIAIGLIAGILVYTLIIFLILPVARFKKA